MMKSSNLINRSLLLKLNKQADPLKKPNFKKQFNNIQSLYLEDKKFLKKAYPHLFKVGTLIRFKRCEFFEKNDKILEDAEIFSFNKKNNCFLLKVFSLEQKESRIENLFLKDIIELWVENLSPKAVNLTEGKINSKYPCPEKDYIRKQVEFYLSENNMKNDIYLQSHQDKNGCTDLLK